MENIERYVLFVKFLVESVPISQKKIAKLIEYKEKRPNLRIGRCMEVAKEKTVDVPLLRRIYARKLVLKKDFMLMFKVNECK